MEITTRQSAVDAGEALLAILRQHIDGVAAGTDETDAAVEVDRRLWESVGDYGDALDEMYEDSNVDDDDASEPEELRFTVRTRYDYTVLDEKVFLSAGKGVGAAVVELLERAGGKPLSALEVASLETGSGILTVHINNEPLVAADFTSTDEPTDLLLIDPQETLAHVVDEPIYGSRAEAEAAVKARQD